MFFTSCLQILHGKHVKYYIVKAYYNEIWLSMKKLLSILLSTVLFTQISFASQEYEELYSCLKRYGPTLSSAYFDGYYTNKQLVNINLGILQASNKVLDIDYLKSKKWFIRYPIFFFNCYV